MPRVSNLQGPTVTGTDGQNFPFPLSCTSMGTDRLPACPPTLQGSGPRPPPWVARLRLEGHQSAHETTG
eukprot:1605590-Pyramimonas_sp.AAC.1